MSPTAARAPSLETIGMSKSFGALRALQDVSIEVPAGSFHALLGENGAGKSTLVKCIMGFYTPDKGQLLLDGKRGHCAQSSGMRRRSASAWSISISPSCWSVTAAENLVVSRADAPSFYRLAQGAKGLSKAFSIGRPFCVPLGKPVSQHGGGEEAEPRRFSSCSISTSAF